MTKIILIIVFSILCYVASSISAGSWDIHSWSEELRKQTAGSMILITVIVMIFIKIDRR